MHDTHNHTHINRYGRKWRGGGRKKPILDIKLVVLDFVNVGCFCIISDGFHGTSSS